MAREVYVSTDVEADGPIPGPYSMLSFGMAVAGVRDGTTFTRLDPTAQTFYRELRPISERFVAEALAVSGLSRAALQRDGAEPTAAMIDNVDWLDQVSAQHRARPVFVAYPLGFDWLFTYWYQVSFTGGSPFGHSGHLDVKTMFATKAGVGVRTVGKRTMPQHLHSTRRHTHHALDDAVEQAELFCNIAEWTGP